MTILRCPICNRWIKSPTASMPFCSERCRRIDLGRWLSEDYGVPYERPETDELPEQEAANWTGDESPS